MKKHNYGFTLAEVLITLVIIGIIAAMTIPTLMNKTNEHETVVAVKKAYSVLGQAYQRMVAENGELNLVFLGANGSENTEIFGEKFVKYLNIQKVCGNTTDGDCFALENYAYLENGIALKNHDTNYNAYTPMYKARLNDGMSLGIVIYYGGLYNRSLTNSTPLNSTCGFFYVDVNGGKGPNVEGIDLQKFWITKYGIYPTGTPDNNEVSGFSAGCRTYGSGCSGWIITKGNMDYLRKDVSW